MGLNLVSPCPVCPLLVSPCPVYPLLVSPCLVCPLQVVVYVPGSKGAPSFVRLYQYPVLGGPTAALANKSFFKADRVTMQWNKKGTIGPGRSWWEGP